MKSTMNRRQFIQVVSTGAAGLAAGACAGGPQRLSGRKRSKPNLLFIWTDEQRADTMAAYGNTKIHAPNLNKLAAESVVFQKAYVTQPVCTPNRSAVMTGLWPHTTGGTKLASKDDLKRIENEHSRAVISPDGWKLCLSDVDKSQFFNLRKNRGETTNLFGSDLHRDVIARLTGKIHQWQETVQDELKL